VNYLLVVVLMGAACDALRAMDPTAQFNEVRRAAWPLLRSGDPDDRVEALRLLGELPVAKSARLIEERLSDESPQVREAAYQALVGLSGNQEVCGELLKMVRRAARRDDRGVLFRPLLAALLHSDVPGVHREIDEFLTDAGSTEIGVLTIVTLADELGRHGQAADVVPLARLASMRVFEVHFGVRRAIVQGLTHIDHKDAVGALIGIIDRLRGEVLADAIDHLAQVTEQIYGMESPAWQRWWAYAGESFEYPVERAQSEYRSAAIDAAGHYYGLPLVAERLVFVLDTSGSMSGLRIAAAKRELVRAISGLSDRAHFGIVVFNDTVSAWQPTLVPATDRWKQAAVAYVNGQIARANTVSYDALEAALTFDTEAVYFVSDGAPKGGKIVAPEQIVAAISSLNRARRISIYTIGVGVGFPGNPLDEFLRALAAKNLGLYRRVDG
jgi:hypothetical protein